MKLALRTLGTVLVAVMMVLAQAVAPAEASFAYAETGADLSVIKASPATVMAGDVFTYTFTVANAGPETATNVRITDVIPAGISFESFGPISDNGLGVYGYSSRQLDLYWSSLAPGASATANIRFTAGAAGTITNTAIAGSALADLNPSNNTSTATTTILADTMPPTTTISISGTIGLNGWYTSSVTITLQATDNPGGSGVSTTQYSVNGSSWTTYSGPFTIDNESGSNNVQYKSTDYSGNVEPVQSATVKIDKTAPAITGARTPAANSYGWNNINVTVSFTATDGLSGVASVSGPTTLSAEGAGQSVTGTATDNAGNSASAAVTGINIDKTPPTVSISGPATVLQGTTISATVAASDGLSGLDLNPAGNLALDTSTVGTRSVTVIAKDKAGNQASATLTYTVWGINGPLAPLTKLSQFPAGGVVPVKFQITDGPNQITNASGNVSIGSASEVFRWDVAKQQYVANVRTTNIKGTFEVMVNINGVGSVAIAKVDLR